MVSADGSSQFSADSQPKSVGLVWGLAATRRSVCIHQMNRVNSLNDFGHDDSTINIVVVIIIIIIIIISADVSTFCGPYVCFCVVHDRVPCKNSRADRRAIWTQTKAPWGPGSPDGSGHFSGTCTQHSLANGCVQSTRRRTQPTARIAGSSVSQSVIFIFRTQ